MSGSGRSMRSQTTSRESPNAIARDGNSRNSAPGPDPDEGRAPPPTRSTGHTSPVTSATLEAQAAEMEAANAAQAHINRLIEEQIKLSRKNEELKEELSRLGGIEAEAPPRRRRHSDDSSSSHGRDIKVKNVSTLVLRANYRDWETWVQDLKRVFKGSPRRYKGDANKILVAQDYMTADCRALWDRYLSEEPGNLEDRIRDKDWNGFLAWSKTLLKDAGNHASVAMQAQEDAQQRERQSPRDFHIYLDSLEKQFPPQPMEARVRIFFQKLQPNLRNHIDLQMPGGLPATREELVSLATRYWDALTGPMKRKADSPLVGSNTKKIRTMAESAAAPSRRETRPWAKPKSWTRGRDLERGKDSEPKPRNPIGKDGKPLKCFRCDSYNHLQPQCPGSKDPQVKRTMVELGKERRSK